MPNWKQPARRWPRTLVAELDVPPVIVARHRSTTLNVQLISIPSGDVSLIAPPLWIVEKSVPQAGTDRLTVRFRVTPCEASAVREAEFEFRVGDGELYYRVPVVER